MEMNYYKQETSHDDEMKKSEMLESYPNRKKCNDPEKQSHIAFLEPDEQFILSSL
jgi:hypothetical protein